MTSFIDPRDPLDPAMIISKKLTKSDLTTNVRLPKQQVESVLTRMNGVTAQGLQNGVEVDVYDMLEGDEYKVTLRCSDNSQYYLGEGWGTMKYSLDLEEGQDLKLYWHQAYKKFIVLNFSYTLLSPFIPV